MAGCGSGGDDGGNRMTPSAYNREWRKAECGYSARCSADPVTREYTSPEACFIAYERVALRVQEDGYHNGRFALDDAKADECLAAFRAAPCGSHAHETACPVALVPKPSAQPLGPGAACLDGEGGCGDGLQCSTDSASATCGTCAPLTSVGGACTWHGECAVDLR